MMFSTKTILFLLLCVSGFLATVAFWSKGHSQSGNLTKVASKLDFPFKVLDDWDWDNFRRFYILLSKEHYSRENLEKLFKAYSLRYPPDLLGDKKLEILVYVNIPPNEKPRDCNRPMDPPGYYASCLYIGVADYQRGDSGYFGRSGDDELFFYKPDPVNSEESKTVILHGGMPSFSGRILDEWETSNGSMKIEARAYELPDAEVKRTYYSFTSVEVSTGNTRYDFIKIRLDGASSIPRKQVRFVNEKTAYIFIGWKYAVTTDGGKTWSSWNAEKTLPDWENDKPQFIREVEIAPDGTGRMLIKPSSQLQNAKTFQTKDYGKTWRTAE